MKFGSFEEYENMADEIDPASIELQSASSVSLRQSYSNEDNVWLPEEV